MKARLGLVGLGLEAYWAQFAGLEARLAGYIERVAEKLRQTDAEVVNLGLISLYRLRPSC
jgi:L-arabinose isomerase